MEIKLLSDNSEDVTYNFPDFTVRSKQVLLSDYPNMAAANHWHDDLEFIIILSGKMSYSINGKSYVLKENQAIFVNSQQMHYGYSSDGSDCSFIYILVPPSLLSTIKRIKESYIIPVCTDASHPFFIFDSSVGWQRNFIEMLSKIHQLCKDKTEGFELNVMSIFYSICYSLYKNVKNDNIHKEAYYDKNLDAMHNMVGYIQQNYQHKIILREIAAAGNVCRSRCCEIFQLFLHKSPISYLTEYRLEKSIEMLDISSYSITEIALQCGFNSSSYFTEIFRQKIGCTPSQYRKNNINISHKSY